MKDNDAYSKGAEEALDTFGIRLAADHLTRRMPDGPAHLGAEWLAKRLGNEKDEYSHIIGSRQSYKKLEKPTQWGNTTSLESSGSNARNYSGMTPYGGV